MSLFGSWRGFCLCGTALIGSSSVGLAATLGLLGAYRRPLFCETALVGSGVDVVVERLCVVCLSELCALFETACASSDSYGLKKALLSLQACIVAFKSTLSTLLRSVCTPRGYMCIFCRLEEPLLCLQNTQQLPCIRDWAHLIQAGLLFFVMGFVCVLIKQADSC